MKRYIVSRSEQQDTIRLEITMEYVLEDYRIAANFNPDANNDILDVEINEMIMDDYQEFIDLVRRHLKHCGFEELDFKQSDRKDSHSVYITFCDSNDFSSETVEIIFYLRVSDHRLHKRKSNGYDRQQAADDWRAQDVKQYTFLNKSGEDIEWSDFTIIVNSNKFKTYGEAFGYVKKYIKNKTAKYGSSV